MTDIEKRLGEIREREYSDMDGNPISLLALVRSEPEWAANQIRNRDALLAQLEAARHEGWNKP